MTEAERQQVIDALELWGTDDVSQEDYENAKQALAIMRREREPQPPSLEEMRNILNGL